MYAVPQEIERKFLVADDDWRRGADQGSGLRQAYLAETDRAGVCVRAASDGRGCDHAGLTIAKIGPESEKHDDLPDWVGREVAGAAQYCAARLAQRRYRLWPEAEWRRDG